MQIDVYSRQQILKLDPQPDVAVISISGPADPTPLKEGWGPLLRVEFHDVVIPRAEMPVMVDPNFGRVVLFDEEIAEQIDAFAWEHKDKNFAVHCAAGVSRSVAVGMFLKEIFEGDLHLHAIHTTAAANSLVHRTLMRKYWEERLS
jgi:predicted protein tyrosine phosphatase